MTPEFSPDGRGARRRPPQLHHHPLRDGIGEVPVRPAEADGPRRSSSTPGATPWRSAYVDGSVARWRVSDGKLLAERKTQAEELYTWTGLPTGAPGHRGPQGEDHAVGTRAHLSLIRELDAPEWVIRVKFTPDGLNLHYAGGAAVLGGQCDLGIFGIEGTLYSLLNRPR